MLPTIACAVGLGRSVIVTLDTVVSLPNLGIGMSGSSDVGIDAQCDVALRLLCLPLLVLLPLLPALEPGVVVFAIVKVDIQTPANISKPVALHFVEVGNGEATDFRPRAVLERVIVQELAAQEESNSEHAPDMTVLGMALDGTMGHLQHVDSLGKIVHAEEDGGTWEAGGGENLRDEFPEGRGDLSLLNEAGSHFGNVFSHQLDIVVEDSTNAARHDGQVGSKFGVQRKIGWWVGG